MIDQQNISIIKELMILEGDYKAFTYKGIECEIKRMKEMGHLCGYLKMDISSDDMEFYICESQFHGGVTYHQDAVGFDCAHSGDMMPLLANHYPVIGECSSGTYRTMMYVEDILKDTIDRIIEYRNEAADE